MQIADFVPASAGLPHLDASSERAMRSLFAKLRRWKGFDLRRHHDVAEDLRQELALDCLAHEDVLGRLSRTERTEHWFRLLQRQLYWLRARPHQRTQAEVEPDACAGNGGAATLDRAPWLACESLSRHGRAAARALLLHREELGNGRLNARATARELGTTSREVRAQRDRLAKELGRDEEFVAFWKRRLVEALVGLAADLLRDEASIRIHGDRTRVRPDPASRLRRIAGIRQRMKTHALPRTLRTVLARWTRARLLYELRPVALTSDAVLLAPEDPKALLWHFEAAIAGGELALAARTLRSARRAGVDPVRVLLGRARLQEARGHEARAARLLARNLLRHPRDARIVASLVELSGGRDRRHLE